MRALDLAFPTLVLLAGPAFAQTTTSVPRVDEAGPAPGEAEAEQSWLFGFSANIYFEPEDRNYVQPTFTADHDWLHFEARYNYEAFDTGSVWVGCNLAGGEQLAWEITPMLGGVFGDTAGIAPGCKGSLRWWQFELYIEGEYVFDTGDSRDSFFYDWSELTLAPLEWFRFGLVAQYTQPYETNAVQRGLLAGFSWHDLDVAAYVFNPDESKPAVVLSVALSF